VPSSVAPPDKSFKAAVYARVSSGENKPNLASQAERLTRYATANGWPVMAVVQEVGSGVNDQRKKLEKLLQDDSWNILVVEHKDRLTRFDFNYLLMLRSAWFLLLPALGGRSKTGICVTSVNQRISAKALHTQDRCNRIGYGLVLPVCHRYRGFAGSKRIWTIEKARQASN